MYLAGRNQVILRHSLIDTMRMLHKIGYGGMELSIVRGMTAALVLDYMDDYVINEVNAVSEELSFPITALACHQNYVTSDNVFNAQQKLISVAKKFGTDIVIMSTGINVQERETRPELYDTLIKKTRALCDTAEEHGVKIAIEVEPNMQIHNFKIFFDVAEKVKSPALKMNFDVGHVYLSEVDLFKAIDAAKNFIVYSHVENMCMGEHCHKLPWEGEIDLLPVYRKLKETCYDGPVSLDIYIQDYETVAPACLEYMSKEIFAKL